MIQRIKLSNLSPNSGQIEGLPANPRLIKDDKFEKLKKSLKDDPEMLELRELLVFKWGEEYVIIGGNMRYRAAVDLDIEELPCKIIPPETPIEKLKAYAMKDNIAYGDYDWDMLANDWDSEDLEDWGLDVWQNETQEHSAIDEDEAPEVDTKSEPKTKIGDIWQLGRHRLMCGDSTSITDIEKLMDGKKADMVFTDPPYGMNLDTDYSSMKSEIFKGGIGGKYDAGIVDNFDPEMINTIMLLKARETFIWGADYFAELLPNKNDGSWIVWDKRANGNDDIEQDKSSDKMYGSCFELCWSKNKHKRDIARVKWAGIFGMSSQDQNKRVHPTQKPLELCCWFLKRYSKTCENIVDLFGGSGTTLIACQQLERVCYMMELDPRYCDVILKRWEDVTGEKATLVSD